ncbi:MAG: MATE family efflux transporter [Prolixibacteraceae bacterium]|nr:MATE family efflux transporter [Prolixibacteraceae bacterium]MBN2649836.1 MATE family efflux transporter [Prolixibacteraceae bacterium]
MLSKYYIYYKRLFKLALPLVFTQAGQMIVHLVDNAMIGQYGTEELAASSFANSVFMLSMIFGIGIFIGITPIIGQALGKNNDTIIAGIIKNGIVLSLILSVTLFLFSYSISFFLKHMQQPVEVYQLSTPYYRLLAYSLIPLLIFMLFKQVGEGLGNTIVAMIATIATNIINIVLNWILIFGKLGFQEYGLDGAGYATLISRIFLPILIIAGFKLSPKINHYLKLLPGIRPSWKGIKNIITLGLPISGQMLVEMSSFSLSAIMMGWISGIALAAHQVALGLASFTFMIANGIAMATTIRVSHQLGQKDFKSMEKVSLSAVHLVLGYMFLCGVGFMIFRFQLPRLFSPDPLVIKQAASLLILAALFQIFDGLQVVSLGILRGFSDVKVPMAMATVAYLLIGLPASYIFAFPLNLGPDGIWMGFLAGLASAGIMFAFRIRKMIASVNQK